MAAPVFCSIFCYALAKISGERWPEIRAKELAEAAHGEGQSSWPGFRTLANLVRLRPVQTYVDGSTLITKARSRASGEFLRSGSDVWVTIDDDVEAPKETLEALLEAVIRTRAIVSVPCILRDGTGLTVQAHRQDKRRVDGNLYRLDDGTGLGLVAFHHDVIKKLAPMVPHVTARGQDFPALFQEDVRDGEWIGEDYRMTRLAARMGIAVYLLLDAPVVHAGLACQMTRDLELLVDKKTRESLVKAGASA